MSNNTSPRARLSVDERRAHLLSVAAVLLAENDLDAVTVEGVARRAGVSRALVYHYFPTKLELVRAVVERESLAFRARLEGLDPGGMVSAYLAYAAEHPAGFRALHAGAMAGDPGIREILAAGGAEIEERLLASSGVEVPTPAERLAVRGLVGMATAMTVGWLDDPAVAPEEVRDTVLAALAAVLPSRP